MNMLNSVLIEGRVPKNVKFKPDNTSYFNIVNTVHKDGHSIVSHITVFASDRFFNTCKYQVKKGFTIRIVGQILESSDKNIYINAESLEVLK